MPRPYIATRSMVDPLKIAKLASAFQLLMFALLCGAVIVMRESQKGIIIGKGGDALRRLGTYSRISISKYIDKKVFLDLKVKVDPDWRENDAKLKKYGY